MLSSEDFVGRYVHGSSSPFEMLVDVAEVAAEIYEREKAMIMKQRLVTMREKLVKKKQRVVIMREKLLKKKPATTPDGDGDIFVASDPWSQRKRSYEQIREMGDTDSNIKNQKMLFQSINIMPELPDDLKNRIKATDGSEVVMVIQKALTSTDVKKCQARLSMPFGQVNMDFLREEEREYLGRQNEMKVTFIEPSGMYGEIVLRQWDMRKPRGKTSSMYVLRKCWHDVSLTNHLQDGDLVQVWSFRVAGSIEEQRRLCLALVVVSRKKERKTSQLR